MGKQLAADLNQAFGKRGRIGRPSTPTTQLFAPRKRSYSVKETAAELNLSVAATYVLLANKKLRGKKIGARLIILGTEIDRFLAELPDAEFDMPSVAGGAA
jgi:Helix-turn-helix domain